MYQGSCSFTGFLSLPSFASVGDGDLLKSGCSLTVLRIRCEVLSLSGFSLRSRSWRGWEGWAVWLSEQHALSVWQAVQSLRFLSAQAWAVVSLVQPGLCLSPPGLHIHVWWIPPAEQCSSLLVCLIPIPPIFLCCLYNESSWISLKKLDTQLPSLALTSGCHFSGVWTVASRLLLLCSFVLI